MQRVAAGDLAHRVPTRGAIREVADTFNTMAVRVERLVNGQRDLMAAVSHELRTPLTRMRLTLELLSDTHDSTPRIEALNRDVTEIDALVSELLESARLHQGTLALAYGEVHADALFRKALAQVPLEPRAVHVHVDSSSPFFGDEPRLIRCLTNLLSNVARYTPPDCTVRLKATADARHTWLTVEDSGPGVAPADRARLFEPFFRVEESRSRTTGGLGLGLMLVKQIVDAHAGSIEALESQDGGLLVRVGIPTAGPGD
jgi:signal transduction histidine kinase